MLSEVDALISEWLASKFRVRVVVPLVILGLVLLTPGNPVHLLSFLVGVILLGEFLIAREEKKLWHKLYSISVQVQPVLADFRTNPVSESPLWADKEDVLLAYSAIVESKFPGLGSKGSTDYRDVRRMIKLLMDRRGTVLSEVG